MTDVACFLTEERNERIVHRDCTIDGCGCGGTDERDFDIVRVDTGEVIASDVYAYYGHGPNAVPAGTMWWQDMIESSRPSSPHDWAKGMNRERPRLPSHSFFDGPHLCVMTPGGLWNVDSRASNCTMPFDYEHRCWVRHGDPPALTVDKDGVTCAAGGGSIAVGTYHGFLRNGFLTDC